MYYSWHESKCPKLLISCYSCALGQGFCDVEPTSGFLSDYFWPETEAGSTATLSCELGPLIPNGMARRSCNPDTAEWDPVSLDECFTCEYLILIIMHPILIHYPFVFLLAVVIEWEAGNVTVLESSPITSLCASFVNPQVNISEFIELTVLTTNITAGGTMSYHSCFSLLTRYGGNTFTILQLR